MCFSLTKASDITYLETTLKSLGLSFNKSGPTDKKRQVHFSVKGPFYNFFFAEYGHKPYEMDEESDSEVPAAAARGDTAGAGRLPCFPGKPRSA